VYFTQGRERGVNAAELDELAADSGRADTGASGDTIVARLDAATRIREGQEAELWVDARAMHIFDPASGRNLSLGDDDGGTASVQAAPARAEAGEPQAPAPGAAGSGGVRAVPGQAGPAGEAT